MEIRKAGHADAIGAWDVYAACIHDFKIQGIRLWDEHYPTPEIVFGDIETHSLHILEDAGECVGVISLNEQASPEYEAVPWRAKDARALIVHRLAVHPKWRGEGLARQMMAFAEDFAVKNGYSAIRFDVFSGSLRAIRFYEQLGYVRVGHIQIPPQDIPFYCYEKIFNAPGG